jgi:hypothetical protein
VKAPWNRGIDTPTTFLKAALSAGNVTGVRERFRSGVNFAFDDKNFWRQLTEDYDKRCVLHQKTSKFGRTTKIEALQFLSSLSHSLRPQT